MKKVKRSEHAADSIDDKTAEVPASTDAEEREAFFAGLARRGEQGVHLLRIKRTSSMAQPGMHGSFLTTI